MRAWTENRKKWVRVLAVIGAVLVFLYVVRAVYTFTFYKASIWFPSYLASLFARQETVADARKHVVFLMVDHYEPGRDEEADARSERWLARFRAIADRHHDSYGNRFRYSWFYPYDEHREQVLTGLCRAAAEGYGEVELHWHHPRSDSQRFPAMLDDAIRWFQRHDALVSAGPNPRTQFGFIHGVWALDDSQPRCGVRRELDILFQHGCYADFTFSTIGTVSQPRKINSIYYATDSDAPKSYDTGEDVTVGKPIEDRLMIFEGPIGLNWITWRLDYAAVEAWARPTPGRIRRWIGANIHVQGRPEWVFVKVYSHGVQSQDVILDHDLDGMLRSLEEICRARGITLHYVTAREAYNLVKAAEAGKSGNPEDFRDYRVPKPATSTLLQRQATVASGP
jgi:hypothetical protein